MRASHKGRKLPASIRVREGWAWDEYNGPIEDILAAGLIRKDQIPEKTRATYYKGRLMSHPGPHARKDEHYLSVTRSGVTRLIVCIGISEEMQEERHARLMEERRRYAEEQERQREAAAKAADKGVQRESVSWHVGHQHQPGALVYDKGGNPIRILRGHSLYQVTDEDGSRSLRFGYLAEYTDGSNTGFFPAHSLRDKEGYETHLKLVYSSGGK